MGRGGFDGSEDGVGGGGGEGWDLGERGRTDVCLGVGFVSCVCVCVCVAMENLRAIDKIERLLAFVGVDQAS